jgi:hypothetical protein
LHVLAAGGTAWQLRWSDEESGWLLARSEVDGSPSEAGRTTIGSNDGSHEPAALLLDDGRLFRLAMYGGSETRAELGRWDVPGAYAVGKAEAGGWTLELTTAGLELSAPVELWILTGAHLSRLEGWC